MNPIRISIQPHVLQHHDPAQQKSCWVGLVLRLQKNFTVKGLLCEISEEDVFANRCRQGQSSGVQGRNNGEKGRCKKKGPRVAEYEGGGLSCPSIMKADSLFRR
jgi:hypothetical protein